MRPSGWPALRDQRSLLSGRATLIEGDDTTPVVPQRFTVRRPHRTRRGRRPSISRDWRGIAEVVMEDFAWQIVLYTRNSVLERYFLAAAPDHVRARRSADGAEHDSPTRSRIVAGLAPSTAATSKAL